MILDRSRAIALADEFTNDPDTTRFHITVFEHPPLRDFLSRGELRRFLIEPGDGYPDIIDVLEGDRPFARWLSPIFAAQYDLVFAKAVERRDPQLLECLVAGRRWVLPQDEERCFRASARLIDRAIEPLVQLGRQCFTEPVRTDAVRSVLDKDRTGQLLALLPSYFLEQLSKAADALRAVSLSLNNQHDAPDEALAVIELSAPIAKRSPSLMQRIKDDRQALEERIEAARKDEARLTLGGQPLEITREGVQALGRSLKANEVTSVRWGVKVGRDGVGIVHHYHMSMAGDSGPPVSIYWMSKDLEAQDALFQQLVRAVFAYVLPGCLRRFQDAVVRGEAKRVGTPCVKLMVACGISCPTWNRTVWTCRSTQGSFERTCGALAGPRSGSDGNAKPHTNRGELDSGLKVSPSRFQSWGSGWQTKSWPAEGLGAGM